MKNRRTRPLLKGLLIASLVLLAGIAAVLIAIFLPVYRDYRLRTQAERAMAIIAKVEAAAGPYIGRTQTFPPTLDAVGIPAEYDEGPVKSIAITDAGFEFTLRSDDAVLKDRTLVLDARLNEDGSVAWSCGTGSLDRRYQPATCRSAFFEPNGR